MRLFKRYYSFIIIALVSLISVAISQNKQTDIDQISSLLKIIEKHHDLDIAHIEFERKSNKFTLKNIELSNGQILTSKEISDITVGRQIKDTDPPGP